MMPGFQSFTFKVATSDGRNFELLEDAEYLSRGLVLYRIPQGATSDGASTPRGTWNALPPFGDYWRAAVLHDAAYRGTLQVFDGNGFSAANLSKADCDNLLLEAMQLCGVDELTSRTIYEGVHLGGASSFTEDRKTA